MAINYITVDRATKSLGADFYALVDAMRIQADKLRQVKEIMDNMTDGATYANIETQFGIPTGKGQTTYNLVAGAVAEIPADTNLSQLFDWIVPAS